MHRGSHGGENVSQLSSIANEGTREQTDKLKLSFQLNKKKTVINILTVSMEIFLQRPLRDTHLHKEEEYFHVQLVFCGSRTYCTIKMHWPTLHQTPPGPGHTDKCP